VLVVSVAAGVGVPVASSARAAGAATVRATTARAAATALVVRLLSMRIVLMVSPGL
jgi:hypothetical protein